MLRWGRRVHAGKRGAHIRPGHPLHTHPAPWPACGVAPGIATPGGWLRIRPRRAGTGAPSALAPACSSRRPLAAQRWGGEQERPFRPDPPLSGRASPTPCPPGGQARRQATCAVRVGRNGRALWRRSEGASAQGAGGGAAGGRTRPFFREQNERHGGGRSPSRLLAAPPGAAAAPRPSTPPTGPTPDPRPTQCAWSLSAPPPLTLSAKAAGPPSAALAAALVVVGVPPPLSPPHRDDHRLPAKERVDW